MSDLPKPTRQQVIDRLEVLRKAIAAGDGGKTLERETLMHIPARPTEDMDCIVAEAIRLLNTRPASGELVEQIAAKIAKTEGVGYHLMHNPEEKAKYRKYAEAAIAALTQPGKVSVSRELLEEIRCDFAVVASWYEQAASRLKSDKGLSDRTNMIALSTRKTERKIEQALQGGEQG